MTLRTDVSVLYVDPRGPYPKLVADWWDEKRDARNYAGPNPVVAHPPCGPWGKFRANCKHQDPSTGPHAVEMVRRFGGVLEHPVGSKLWWRCLLPRPGELPDAWGGRTFTVNQCDWGHVTRKPTLLYCVGALPGVAPARREPTHSVANGRGQRLRDGTVRLRATTEQCRQTPIAFAEWLIELAAQARKERAA